MIWCNIYFFLWMCVFMVILGCVLDEVYVNYGLGCLGWEEMFKGGEFVVVVQYQVLGLSVYISGVFVLRF